MSGPREMVGRLAAENRAPVLVMWGGQPVGRSPPSEPS
jgi:hypothetical protein